MPGPPFGISFLQVSSLNASIFKIRIVKVMDSAIRGGPPAECCWIPLCAGLALSRINPQCAHLHGVGSKHLGCGSVRLGSRLETRSACSSMPDW